jgi:membrane-associated phospholipid phosphatase
VSAEVLGQNNQLESLIANRLRGKSKTSVYLTYVALNVVLMLVLFYVVLNNYAYDWTGQMYPEGSGFNLATGLDLAIPFVPETVVFYVYLFYPLSLLTMVYFGFVEYKKGPALGLALIAINAIAVAVYVVFPVSTFGYRQDLLAHPLTGNFWADQVYNVFQNDTSFNCLPSLHAAVSTICAYTWFRYQQLKPNKATKTVAAVTAAIAVGVVLSTLFVKQHYIVDEVAGVALALIVGKLVFDRFWKKPETLKP